MVPSLHSILPTRLPILGGRRVVVIDAGSHSLKLLLVRFGVGGLRLLWKECIDLRAEGLLSPTDISRHLRKRLLELDYDELVLVLPQHLSISQIIDLTSANELSVSELIEEEIVRLSGLSESAIVYHYSRIRPFRGFGNPFWVTLCQESEVVRHVENLTMASTDVCEVTSSASAMIAAYQAQPGLPACGLLLNLGAQNTVLVIEWEGQGVFVATFASGGQAFTKAVAADMELGADEAEELKRSRNLFDDLDRFPRLRSALDDWCSQVERTFAEWLAEHREGDETRKRFEVLLCGGGAAQNGLNAYLQTRIGLPIVCWDGGMDEKNGFVSGQFLVAYGAALHVSGKSAQSASLLPSNLRESHNRVRSARRLQALGLVMLLIAAALLSIGIWNKLKGVNQKNAILDRTHAALAKARNADRTLADLAEDYESVRGLVEKQKATWDTLRTLSLLQASRSNQGFWYLLFADRQSYFAEPIPSSGTNAPAVETNRIATAGSMARTNEAPLGRGFIVELCIPDSGSGPTPTLSGIVTNLRNSPLFGNVDVLPSGLRRELVDRKLIIPNRHFVLTIESAENEFQKPAVVRPQSVLPVSAPTRPLSRTFKEQAETAIRPQPQP